ncbi:unnamed protein product [Clonostachys rosea]|uniref:Heterokaryon incompatibility domain-containing protein n=1 Tax=Bionectria ochroleuca TaxID=29856 RepID=A0ABY6UP53_BIOOC|nr:unnamed protein product [Clonostachys rosea]
MRLLNTTTLELKEFFGSSIPQYAILSHTWSDEEVLYQDIQNGSASSKKAFAKVSNFCSLARDHGQLKWGWVDTCCIDKSSSAELSEAINSMYKWYHRSAVCYVYLADVQYIGKPRLKFETLVNPNIANRFDMMDIDGCLGESSSIVYQPVQIQDYSQIRQRAFYEQNLGSDVDAGEPPLPTSRGIRVSLRIKHPDVLGLPLLAWLYCGIGNRLLCIALESYPKGSNQGHSRYCPSWLVGVDKSLLSEFRLENVFLRVNGEGVKDNSVLSLHARKARALIPMQIELVTHKHTVEIVEHQTSQFLGADVSWEVVNISTNESRMIICCCKSESHISYFKIGYGISGSRAWCTIIEELQAFVASTTADVESLRANPSSHYSDRASKLSTKLPNTIVTAAIQVDHTGQSRGVDFILHVRLWTWPRHPLWAQLCLSQTAITGKQTAIVRKQPSQIKGAFIHAKSSEEAIEEAHLMRQGIIW